MSMHYKHQPELDIKQFNGLRSPLRFDIFPLKQNSVILVFEFERCEVVDLAKLTTNSSVLKYLVMLPLLTIEQKCKQ